MRGDLCLDNIAAVVDFLIVGFWNFQRLCQGIKVWIIVKNFVKKVYCVMKRGKLRLQVLICHFDPGKKPGKTDLWATQACIKS